MTTPKIEIDDSGRFVCMNDYYDSFEMQKESVNFGTFQLRYSHLLLEQLEVYRGEQKLTDFAMRLLKQEWPSFIYQLAVHFHLHGFCPVTLSKRLVLVTDEDKARAEAYGEYHDKERQYVEVDIPIVPVLGTYEIKQRLIKFEQVPYVIDMDGNERSDIFIIKSKLCPLPDYYTGKFQSEGASLLPDWRRIQREEKITEQVRFSNALPVQMIQRQNRTDMQHFTELQASQINDLRGMEVTSTGVLVRTNGPSAGISPAVGPGFDKLKHQILVENKFVDRSDLIHEVREGYQVAAGGNEAKLTTPIEESRTFYAQRVALVMRVPWSYIQGGTNKGGALIQNQTGHDPERARLISHVSIIRDDIANAMSEIWIRMYGIEDKNVKFHIPIPTMVNPESIFEMLEYDAITDKVALEELLNHHNIQRNRVSDKIDMDRPQLKRFRLSNEEQKQMKAQTGNKTAAAAKKKKKKKTTTKKKKKNGTSSQKKTTTATAR